MGNHTPGHNHESLSVCLIGGLDEQGSVDERSFTGEQWETLSYLIAMALAQWPDIKVARRYDLQKRKGDCWRQALTALDVAKATNRVVEFPDAKPITEVIKVRPPKPKDIIRDHLLDPC